MVSPEERFVTPFYLQMMNCNALEHAEPLWADLVRVGQEASLTDVQWLLRRGEWRPMVMGAWFSLGFDADEVGSDLLAAMARSAGAFTAPPLAVVCALLLGRDAHEELARYAQREGRGVLSAGVVPAVLTLIGGAPAETDSQPEYASPEVERLATATALLALAARLRTALSAP